MDLKWGGGGDTQHCIFICKSLLRVYSACGSLCAFAIYDDESDTLFFPFSKFLDLSLC